MDRKDKLPYPVDPNKALNLRKGIFFLLVKMVQLKFKETLKFEILRLYMIWFWASETNTKDYQKFCSKMINRYRSKEKPIRSIFFYVYVQYTSRTPV